MKVLRKVFVPLLAFFALFSVLFVSLLLLERYNIRQRTIREEAVMLQHDLRVHVDFLQIGAFAIATDWAHNPSFAQALAEGDRERLLRLTQPVYRALKEELDIRQVQFHTPPATSFLRLHAPLRYGDDLSQLRPMVVEANTELRPVVGLEVGRAGLGLRAVVPVFYHQRHVGSVEAGLGIGSEFVETLRETSGAEWSIWLLPQYATEADLLPPVQIAGEEGRLALMASTLDNPPRPDEQSSLEVMDGGSHVVGHRQINGKRYITFAFPLYDYDHRLIGIAQVFYDEGDILQEQQQYLGLYLFLFAVSFVIAGSGIYLILEHSLSPLRELDAAVEAFAAGKLDQPLAVKAEDDEIGELAKGVEHMRQRLHDLIQQMGSRIEERTEELRRRSQLLLAVAHLSRVAASIRDPGELLQTMAERMTEEFGFYHVGIFLRDARGEYMVLQSASSEGGKRMLEAGHRLRIGETGIVGYVAYTGNPRVTQATAEDETFFNNPYLPQTRAEMALPLRIEGEVIGVLDVQATEVDAFEETDVSILQALADQLALALHNARLLQEAEERLQEVNRLLVERSVENWREQLQSRWSLRYLYDGVNVRPLQPGMEAEVGSASEASASVVMDFPLEPRPGETIGRLRLGWPSTPRPAELEIVRSVTGEVAAALEGARLFVESQDMLVEAELLYRVQRAIASAQSADEIISIFAEDLFGGALDRLILLRDQGTHTGVFLAFWGRNVDDPVHQRLGEEITLPYTVSASNDPFFCDDLSTSSLPEEDKEVFRSAGVQSIAVIPLVTGGSRWGWLIVEAVGRTYTFMEREKRLLRILSESAAVALQNILLVEHAQRRVRREQQAREIADEMQAAADVEVMLKRVARELRSALGASYVAIRLGEEEGGDDGSAPEEER